MAAAHCIHNLLSRQALPANLLAPGTLLGTQQQQQQHNMDKAGCLKQKLRPARRRRRSEQALPQSLPGCDFVYFLSRVLCGLEMYC